jgi:hypothetical protein
MIFDNWIAVQVPFLPCKCRSDGISLEVATDPQSSKQGYKVVTRNPTGNPIEPS